MDEQVEVYTWGDDEYGELLHHDSRKHNALLPKLIERFALNLDIRTYKVLNREVCIVFDLKACIYSLGDGGNGRLGHGDLKNSDRLRKIAGLASEKIVKIAGTYHTLFLNYAGVIFGSI